MGTYRSRNYRPTTEQSHPRRKSSLAAQQAVAFGEEAGFGAAGGFGFLHDVAHVTNDCIGAYEQLVGDSPVGHPGCNELKHFDFTL